MTALTAAEIAQVRAEADLLVSAPAVEQAVDRMAAAIEARIGRGFPLLLGVMVGGVVPLGMLLRRLDFPLEVDYVHATRYGAGTTGGELQWLRAPPDAVRGRVVLLVDDVLDGGVTLAGLIAACRALGAAEVLTAVVVTKAVARRPGLERADFSAIDAPDRYLFGCGMDYRGCWRNAGGIYAKRDS